MMTVVGSGTLCILLQAWYRNFDSASLTILTFFVICMGYVISQLFSRIEAVKHTPSDADIGDVRQGLGRLAAVHHLGLFTVGGLTLLQLLLVVR